MEGYTALGTSAPPRRRLRRRRYNCCLQLSALTRKNVLVYSRRLNTLLFFILAPTLLMLLLWLVKVAVYTTNAEAEVVPLTLSRCKVFNVYGQIDLGRELNTTGDKPTCVTVAFAPSGSPAVVGVMRVLAQQTGLRYGLDIVPFESRSDISAQLFADVGSIDMGLIFDPLSDNGRHPHPPDTPDTGLQYQVWYNKSAARDYKKNDLDPLFRAYGVDGRLLALQVRDHSNCTATTTTHAPGAYWRRRPPWTPRSSPRAPRSRAAASGSPPPPSRRRSPRTSWRARAAPSQSSCLARQLSASA
jgi:hypothetical protein